MQRSDSNKTYAIFETGAKAKEGFRKKSKKMISNYSAVIMLFIPRRTFQKLRVTCCFPEIRENSVAIRKFKFKAELFGRMRKSYGPLL